MSAIETKSHSSARPAAKARKAITVSSLLNGFLDLLSSVRFGVIILCLLVVANMLGMIIMQQNVEGFDKYYAESTPSQQLVYSVLGLFDIYHTWYFYLLLLTLSLNLVLASIDRFPSAWKYISEKKLEASRAYLLKQEHHARIDIEAEGGKSVKELIAHAFRSVGLKSVVIEKDNRTIVFGERGVWNRLGAYAVHVALLTIFTGFFLTSKFGVTGQMQLMPGTKSSEIKKLDYYLDTITPVSVGLPFSVTCTDIQQKLIKKEGSIQSSNTIDWLTRIKIKDEYGERDALVHLNDPYDYRGYRLFQASFLESGVARTVTLRLTPEGGGTPQEVSIPRDGSTTLADGTKIEFMNFYSDFSLQGGKPESASNDYNNPAAQLKVTTPSGQQLGAYAFSIELPTGAPIGAPIGGYKFRLIDYEKVALGHILSIQHDPGRYPFYIGGVLLGLCLGGVFFFSHQRVWAVVTEGAEGRSEVVLGGNTNRNKLGFEDRFKRLTKALGAASEEVKET
jgi:cytochrome c biogenesis protein